MSKQEWPNKFLENQARIMEARRLQDEQRKSEAKQIPVGAVEKKDQRPFDPSAPVVVERYNAGTGEVVSTRVLPGAGARPIPQRIVKPSIRSVESIKEDLIALGDKIDAAGEAYNTSSESLDRHYCNEEKASLRIEVEELEDALKKKQARLNQLDSIRAPQDVYLDVVSVAERDIAGLASELLTSLSEMAAQRIYRATFDRLPRDSQQACQLRYVDALSKFRLRGNYTTLSRKVDAAARGLGVLPTVEETSKRAGQLVVDLNSLLDNNDLFEGTN